MDAMRWRPSGENTVPTEFYALLLRNTLASWVVNTEFAAPVLIYLYAVSRRRQLPRLERFLRLPVVLLVLAGLVRQIHEQFVLPWGMIADSGVPVGMLSEFLQILFAVLLFAGYGGLLWAVHYRRRPPSSEDPFDSSRSEARNSAHHEAR